MARLGLLVVALVSAGCARGATTLVLDVTVADGDPRPSAVEALLFGHAGSLGSTPATVPPGSDSELGLIPAQLPDEALQVRVVVQCKGVPALLGANLATTTPHEETRVLIELSSATFDQDGDGIPDVVDNCPSVPNPTQTNTGNGDLGDACASMGGS